MFIERLKDEYGFNMPIFTSDILSLFSNYSRPRIFQLIKKAINDELLLQFEKGVYYIPTKTRYGNSVISLEQVIQKKYIENKDDVYGIYGGLNMQLNFLLTEQVPTTIEVITNKETTWVREIKIHGRKVILHKSRCVINKDNVNAYMLLELFNNLDLELYKDNDLVRREIKKFAQQKCIRMNEIISLSSAFPAKATKKIIESGFINEITQ